MVERPASLLQECFKRDSILVLLDEYLRARVPLERAREADRRTVTELVFERREVVGLDAEIDLTHHHLSKGLDLLGEREPLHAREEVERRREEHHDLEVAPDHLLDARVEDLDCDGGRGNVVRDVVGGGGDEGSSETRSGRGVLEVLRAEVVGREEVGVKDGSVDLGDRADPERLLGELDEDVGEGFAEGALDDALRVPERVGLAVRVELTEELA